MKYDLFNHILKPYKFRELLKEKFNIRPHDIRRAVATFEYHKTNDILKVQYRLDHKNPNTSWLYVKVLQQKYPKIIEI